MKSTPSKPEAGAVRPVIESVKPELSGGRHAVKRVQGDLIRVSSTVILDGHDHLACQLLYRHESDSDWTRVPMQQLKQGKDLWEATFPAKKLGEYRCTVCASVDRFGTWRSELEKKFHAGQELHLELREGEALLKSVLRHAKAADRGRIRQALDVISAERVAQVRKVRTALRPDLLTVMDRYPDVERCTRYERELRVTVEREKAVYSAWYEFFPRSTSGSSSRHGTFKDAEKMLPYVAGMGFDVVYLPPIHPIGFAFRKGKDNSLDAGPSDPGSPWGIGASSGGHKSVHPELGTLADFQRFVRKARTHDLEVALDIAFQCSPDHPYVKKHPEWFKVRPDGSIQYAENPPKKYQDIYPFHFESAEWDGLWDELKSVVLFWIKQGIRIFRVDNPHTKPVRFWEWLIREIKRDYPETIFLSEAFTRPAMMYQLAKIGFTQSYTYFTWRNTPQEFRKYLEELTQTEVAEYFRPNFWPNTPDILPIHLQKGGRPAFVARAALAATLSSTYGIYGPAYEHCVNKPFKEGGEEYAESEKYEIKAWDLKAPGNISDFLGRLNAIRKDNPALRRNHTIRFHTVDNENIVCFSKHTEDFTNIVFVVVNLDFTKSQSGSVDLPLEMFGFEQSEPFIITDLLTRFSQGAKGRKRSFRLNPGVNPVAIFRVEK